MQACQCECGNTEFELKGKPLVRMLCHCTICQEFNQAPFGDVSIFLAKDVELKDKNSVELKQYKKPPAVERGKCTQCQKPVIEFFDLPLMPALTIVPSNHIPCGDYSLEPATHIFYHSRVADADDNLPKHEGFMKSQMALTAKLCGGMLKRWF